MRKNLQGGQGCAALRNARSRKRRENQSANRHAPIISSRKEEPESLRVVRNEEVKRHENRDLVSRHALTQVEGSVTDPQYSGNYIDSRPRNTSMPHAAWADSASNGSAVSVDRGRTAIDRVLLQKLAEVYFYEKVCEKQSKQTIDQKRVFLKMLLRFLDSRGFTACGRDEMLEFFSHLANGHEEPEGRFGLAHLKEPLMLSSLRLYHVCLGAIFNWLVKGNHLDVSPLAGIARAKKEKNKKPALAPETMAALISAAKNTTMPERDLALLAFLLDTACRSKEVLGLRTKHVDLLAGRAEVITKGGSKLTVFLSPTTVALLEAYLRVDNRLDADGKIVGDTPMWLSRGGQTGLTRSGLQRLMKRLRDMAGFTHSCSPHNFRRFFAVDVSRSGWNSFTLQAALGHENLEMTLIYTQLAQTDVEAAHRKYSPVQRHGLFA